MKVKILDSAQVQLPDSSDIRGIGQLVFEGSLGLQSTEKLVIVTDKGKWAEAELLVVEARKFTKSIQLLELIGMTDNAQEPPVEVTKALKQANVAILVTTFSLSHTRAREAATKVGTRIASMPGITKDMMQRTLAVNFLAMKNQSQKLANILTKAKKIEVFTPAGTKLKFSVAGRTAIADIGDLRKSGDFGNLPAGEAFLAPIEGTTEGTLVVDGALADISLDAPVSITIKAGLIQQVSGVKAADNFMAVVKQAGPKAKVVAEFGIGTNEKALVIPDVLEAEKALHTCHIAFGDNAGFGGTNSVAFHSDCVILQPTMICDGQMIMNKGKVII